MALVIQIPAESNLATESVNVWHYEIPGTAPVTEANSAITALDTFYGAITSVLSAATWTIGRVVRTVDQTPNQYIGATPQTQATTGATVSPLQVCALVSFTSSTVGGSYRGRKYLGPITTGSVAANGRDLDTAELSTIFTAASALLADTTNGIALGTWSRKPGVGFTPATSVSVSGRLHTQRRRLF